MDVNALKTTLECSLCLSLICEPISISCGHTFCRVCLVKSLTRHKKKCPTCREVCHVAAESAAENIMIKALSQQLDPALYEARASEFQVEKQTWNTLFPIFYYNNAMFPGSKLSLHLFEPRYKLMMQRVVNSNRAFAYVPNFTNYSAAIGDIALVAELKEVEFLSDGRCLLEAALGSRQRIIDHYVEEGTQGLHFCRLESYNDTPVNDSNAVAQLTQMKEDAQTLVRSFLVRHSAVQVESMFGTAPATVEGYSLWLSAVCPLSSNDKYDLLISRNTAYRLERCVTCLREIETRYNRRAAVINAASTAASSAAATGVAALRNLASLILSSANIPDNIYDDEGDEGEEEEGSGSDNDELDPDADLPQQRTANASSNSSSGATGSASSTSGVSQLLDGLQDVSFHEDEDDGDDVEYVNLEFTPDDVTTTTNASTGATTATSTSGIAHSSSSGDMIDVDLASSPSPRE